MKHVWRDSSPRNDSVRYEEQEEALNQAMDVTYTMNVREQSIQINSRYYPSSKNLCTAVKQFLAVPEPVSLPQSCELKRS